MTKGADESNDAEHDDGPEDHHGNSHDDPHPSPPAVTPSVHHARCPQSSDSILRCTLLGGLESKDPGQKVVTGNGIRGEPEHVAGLTRDTESLPVTEPW